MYHKASIQKHFEGGIVRERSSLTPLPNTHGMQQSILEIEDSIPDCYSKHMQIEVRSLTFGNANKESSNEQKC